MIIYSPLDGDAFTSPIPSKPRHCFLMTRLGKLIPVEVAEMRSAITSACSKVDYQVIDASAKVTGRDFLLKIWKEIAASPLAVGIVHEDIPETSQANIYYELGVAQALGKETVLVKSAGSKIPSDFVRTEYIEFNSEFGKNFGNFLAGVFEQAEHYEIVSVQLERNPILAIDYLRRAFLITGDSKYQKMATQLRQSAGLEARAANSLELLAASF